MGTSEAMLVHSKKKKEKTQNQPTASAKAEFPNKALAYSKLTTIMHPRYKTSTGLFILLVIS